MRLSSIILVLLLAGCKVHVVVPENGHMETESAAFSCGAAETCIVDVSDLFFDETYLAIPDDGFVFRGWKRRERDLFGGSNESARLFSAWIEAYPTLLGTLESDEIFYLEAEFVELVDYVTYSPLMEQVVFRGGLYVTASAEVPEAALLEAERQLSVDQ